MDFKDLFFKDLSKPDAKVKRFGEYLDEPVSLEYFKKDICKRISNFNINNESYINKFYYKYVNEIFPRVISKDKKKYSKYFFRTECLDLGSNSTQDDYWLSRGWLSKKEIEEQKKKKYASGSFEFGIAKGLSENESQERIDKIQYKIKKKRKVTYKKRSEENSDYWKEQNVFSMEYWIKQGHSEEKAKELAKIESDKQTESLKNFHKNNLGYMKDKIPVSTFFWLKQGYTKEEAKEKVREAQLERAFTLKKCIERYGKDEGVRRFNERQKKWSSKIEEMYQNGLFSKIPKSRHSSCYSKPACLLIDNLHLNVKDTNIKSYKGTEFSILVNNKRKYYDFTNIDKKKIIEFNGDFWHCNPKIYDKDYFHPITNLTAKQIWKRDRKKIELAKSKGYDVKVVWESDYWDDPDKVIDECLEFLNS